MVLHGTYADGVIDVVEKDLLNDYSNSKIEIEIFFNEQKSPEKKHSGHARGILKKYRNPELRGLEDSAWAEALKVKHGIS